MARMDVPLAVIGGGIMAKAIIQGGDAGGVLTPAMVVVAEPDESKHASLRSLGVAICKAAHEALSWLSEQEAALGEGQLLLAVKPQSLADVARDLAPALAAAKVRRVVITILAGVPTQRVRAALGDIGVIRAMPNTPAKIRQGVTAIAIGAGASEQDASLARHVFSGVGQVVVSIEEGLMDAFTAVAGSGPAYVFYLAQTMVEAAVSLGFERSMAVRVVQETIGGSGALLAQTGGEPSALLAGVKSKGGTTEAALNVLENRKAASTLIEAITAARDRGRELGR